MQRPGLGLANRPTLKGGPGHRASRLKSAGITKRSVVDQADSSAFSQQSGPSFTAGRDNDPALLEAYWGRPLRRSGA